MPHKRAAIQRFPVTLLCAVAIFLLHQSAVSYDREHTHGLGGRHAYGAASQLFNTAEPELYGHFSLWEGEWWRVLGSGFHHADWVHLICNAIGLVLLGRLLEPRIGSRWMFVFLIVGTFVSLLPCFLVGQPVVGLSGGIYAVFGLLFLMRFHDEKLREQLPDILVLLFLLYLPVGIVLKELDAVRISNLGHASGLIYGVFAGLTFFPATERVRIRRFWFFAGHLLLIPAVYFLMHPFWNARYFWWQGTRAAGEERIELLEKAVHRDPSLAGVWRSLAAERQRRGETAKAWQMRFAGLRNNPTDQKLQQAVNLAWRRAGRKEEQLALNQLRSGFPESAEDWRRNLGLYTKPYVPNHRRKLRWFVYDSPPRPTLLDDLYWPPLDDELFSTPSRPQTAPPVDPNQADSALLGTTL